MSRRYGRRRWADRVRPRVLDVAPGLVHESGPERDGRWAPERLAVMAHWSTDPMPSRSVVTMLRELDAAGYETVLVSAAEVAGPLGRVCIWAPGEPALPPSTTILRRVNVGYDFGSWSCVLAAFPGVCSASRVLLVNDSLIGPFASLSPVLAHFAGCPDPVWGLSASLQHRPHIQSFFVGYKEGILGHPALRRFWSDIRVESRKAKIVRFNELALSEALDDAGIGWRSMFAPEPGGPPNPTIEAWEGLWQAGFPFVKAEVALAPTRRVPNWERLASTVGGQHMPRRQAWLPPGARPVPPPAGLRVAELPARAMYALDVDGVRGLRDPIGARVSHWVHRGRPRRVRADG